MARATTAAIAMKPYCGFFFNCFSSKVYASIPPAQAGSFPSILVTLRFHAILFGVYVYIYVCNAVYVDIT
jgi:hypothetical protein